MAIDYMSNAQRIEAWVEEQGGQDAAVLIGNYFYWPTGAYAERSHETGLGLMATPSDDDRERWAAIIKYREAKLRQAKDEFEQLQDSLIQRAKANQREARRTPPPPMGIEEAKKKLKKLRKEVIKWQRSLDKARQEYDDAKPEHLIRQEEEAARNQQANSEFLAAVEAIKI